MTKSLRSRRWLSAAAVALALTAGLADQAEARRGGSFGSRGMRTYAPSRSTYTAPGSVGPVQRSMTPNRGGYGQAGYGMQRPGYGRGMGGARRGWIGPLLGGLALGGLFGMMMGHGFGGGAGFLGLLVQLAVIGFILMLVMRLFRRRREASLAGSTIGSPMDRAAFDGPASPGGFMGGAPNYAAAPEPMAPMADPNRPDEIGLGQADFDAFERLLTEVQGAFGREDYGALRERLTPEVMSYLSEELSQNAVAGRRNEVRDVRLLQGDLSEAWREGDAEYATVAMRYAGIDLMRDRTTGRVLEGDETNPTETTELWTFVREPGGPWRLSAIQEASGG